jgi:hypothetical protein
MSRPWSILAASAGAYLAAVAYAAWLLPADTAHVRDHGQVAGQSSRLQALLPFLAIGAFVILLSVLAVGSASMAVRRVPATQWRMLHKRYWATPEREPVLRRMIVTDIAIFTGLINLAVGALPVSVVLTSRGCTGGLASAAKLAPLGCILGIPLYLVWMLTIRYRPPTRRPKN